MLVSDLNMFNNLKDKMLFSCYIFNLKNIIKSFKKLSRDNIIEIVTKNQQVIIKDEIAINSILKGSNMKKVILVQNQNHWNTFALLMTSIIATTIYLNNKNEKDAMIIKYC